MPAPSFSFLAAAPSFDRPILIERAEIVSFDNHFFARVWSGEFCGVAALGHWTPALLSLWQTLVLPFWVGRDARELAADLTEIARIGRDSALAGAPLQMAIAGVELAIWDLLGQKSGRAVAALLADKPRAKMPVYLSSARRDNSAHDEIEWLDQAVKISGARAVEIQIGGPNWNETEARDRELFKLAREKWGEKFTVYADAAGSFEAEKAVQVGQMLHEYKVAWLEEPCDAENFEATRAVAAGVQLPVAGGKNESSWFKWKWLLENCALDIARPDLFCNGGLLRSLQLAQFAASLGVSCAPYSPTSGPLALPALHFAAIIEKPAPFLQLNPRLGASPAWWETPFEIRKGAVTLPQGAGWGARYNEEIWRSAEILAASRV